MKTKLKHSIRSKGKAVVNSEVKAPSNWRHLLSGNRFVLFVSTVLLFVIFSYLITTSTPIALKSFQVGDIIEADLMAVKSFVDEKAYERRKAEVVANLVPITTTDLTVQLNLRQNIEGFFNHLLMIRSAYQTEKLSTLQKIYIATVKGNGMDLTEDTLKALVQIDEAVIKQDMITVQEVVAQVMTIGVSEEGILDAKLRIDETLVKLSVSPPVVEVTRILVDSYLRSNVVIDEKKTETAKQNALDDITRPTVEKGSLLAVRGQIVDEVVYERLLAAGYGSYGAYTRLGYALASHLAIMVILSLYYAFSSSYLNQGLSTKRILLSTTAILMTVLINRIVGITSPFLVHVCLYTLTMCMFYNRQYAVTISIILAALTLLIEPVPVSFAIYAPLSAIACGLMLKEVHQRSSILYSGTLIALFNFVIGGVYLLGGGERDQSLLRDLMFLVGNGFLYAILTIGTLPIFEFVFKLITPIKLLELSSPNQALLKLLMIEAPGSYHHSIIVGNLSDEATRAIGGDSLLARVGAYYHDIGKIQRPYFFKENQLGMDNPHDAMSPESSAEVIKDHVAKGVELAKVHHLPEEIIQFIESHHGTSTIKFFYYKALKENDNTPIEIYQYRGRLPQSKELAIVMLADTVEAVSRTLEIHTVESHETMLNKVFQDKYESGQLVNSPLTFQDLEKIKLAFLKTLSGLYHERIVYPEEQKKEIK